MAQQSQAPKRTSLVDAHVKLGAKMVDFSGWYMPVSYSSVLKEHAAVRTNVGIFDVSHMGEARVSGTGARDFLQYAAMNNIDKLAVGGGQYSAILNEDGGFVDDLIVYRIGPEEYFLCLNASNASKDIEWLKRVGGDFHVTIEDECEKWSQIAVQGPRSRECLLAAYPALRDHPFSTMKYMTMVPANLLGSTVLIARTGYTGEHGYEIYLPNAISTAVWDTLLATDFDGPSRALPCGLGARDTLRLEACYLLYGSDMDQTVNPVEAGVKWAMKGDSADFIGKSGVERQLSANKNRKIYAFTMAEDGIPRHGMDIFVDDQKIGSVTSGGVLPTVGGSGGMALLDRTDLKIGTEIFVDIRGKRKLARLARRPLYTANVNS